MPEVEIDWEPLIELAGKVAYEVSGKWSVVEADDVKQEILLHAMEQRKYLVKALDDEGLLRKIFWTAGKRYAAKERAHYDLMDDQYFYTPDEVRTVLRSFIYTDEEIGALMGKEDDLLRCRVDDNISSARMDAQQAMKKLTPRYQALIHQVFICGIPTDSGSADERAAYRAVDSLTAHMNRLVRTSRKADING